MKWKFAGAMLLFICSLLVVACQPEPAPTPAFTDTPTLSESYPLEDSPLQDQAYPITEADTGRLLGTWSLIGFVRDGESQETFTKSITFRSEASYEQIVEAEVITGDWEILLNDAGGATLILYPEGKASESYTVLTLDDALLHLSAERDGVRIDEFFAATD